jgi:tRNA A37 N6-isopentenylltransferase MiaA
MIENGLIDEINKIQNPSKTVLQAIGMNLSENLEENINIKTKRLAKKQITWFKKEDKLKMIESDNEEEVYNSIMEIINV